MEVPLPSIQVKIAIWASFRLIFRESGLFVFGNRGGRSKALLGRLVECPRMLIQRLVVEIWYGPLPMRVKVRGGWATGIDAHLSCIFFLFVQVLYEIVSFIIKETVSIKWKVLYMRSGIIR